MWIGPDEATFPPVALVNLTQLLVVLLVQMLRVRMEIASALRYVRLIFFLHIDTASARTYQTQRHTK